MKNSAQIILDWLNKDLSLIPQIEDIKKSFSDGYLFGKIFHILKLISQEEFSEFIDSKKSEDINKNFSLVRKYCKKIFNFIIFEKETNQIKNEHLTSACLLLYKIRNGVYKIKINFNNIKFFGDNFSDDEISKQIKDLIRTQLGDAPDENEKSETNRILLEKNDNINILDNNNIKEVEEENSENISNKPKTNRNKRNNKVIRFMKYLPPITTTKIFNKLEFKKTMDDNNNNYSSIKFAKTKSKLMPLNNFSFKKKSNSTENIFIKKEEKNIDDVLNLNNINRTLYSRNDKNNSNLIDVSYFNKKLDELGITKDDYKIKERNIINANTSSNDILFEKFNKTNFNHTPPKMLKSFNNANNITNLKTAEEISDELKNNIKENKAEFDKKILKKNDDEKKINIFKINKNIFNMNKKELFPDNVKSTANTIKRINYSERLLKNNKMQMNEAKSGKNKFTFYPNNQKTLPKLNSSSNMDNIKASKSSLNIYKKDESLNKFDSKLFFKNLSHYTCSSYKNICEKKYLKKKKISNKIREIILYIVDMAMEGYIYQSEHKSEIMDVNTFIKFYLYFLKNKPLRKKYIPVELANHKRAGKIEQIYDRENICNNFTNEEKNYIEDYIYYLGIWNDEKIIKNNLRGLRLNYKYITNKNYIKENNKNYFGMIEYEPTALENEDLTLPDSIPVNYNLGNVLQEIISHHYNKPGYEINNDISPSLNGKWDYIPYKISLIGYPLSGRKTLAKKITNIYPNMKIYSMRKIINYFFDLYLQLADPEIKPEEKQSKKKGKKINKKEKEKENDIKIPDREKESVFERHERQQKFKEMKPLFDSMKTFIDYKFKKIKITNPYILSDEALCLLLVTKIEEDFPLLSPNKIDKIFLERQKNIKDIENQIELLKKKKLEAKKPEKNYDSQIEKLENDIKSIKIKSISGFILIDYPININQSLLLENYLTGFIEQKRQKISDIEKIIKSTNSIVDYKLLPKKKKIKISGLNFIINIVTKENIINERFISAKYDPIEKILYTGKNIVIENKKLKERLINNIPYLSQELFEYYKEEYNNNINKIINLYSEFGFLIKKINNENFNLSNINKKEIIKSFYSIEAEDIKDFYNFGKIQKNKKSKSKDKKKKKENEDEESKEENVLKDKIFNFICNVLIEKLYKENNRYEEELFNLQNMDKNIPSSVSDLNINKIKIKYKNKFSNKNFANIKLIENEQYKTELIRKDFCLMNKKYYENIGIFIHLMKSQKMDIYERLNLIQNKFRDYINKKKPKKRLIISNYIKRYNDLYNLNPEYLNNEQIIFQLNSDIEEVRTEIWNLIIKKREDSITELNQIKYSGFFEVEFIKFYNNIKALLLNETEKFVTMFNDMVILYKKKKDAEEDKDINILIEQYKKNLVVNPSIIMNGIKEFEYYYNKNGDAKLNISLNEVTNIILKNLELIFKNSIKMLFIYNDELSNIFGRVRKLVYANFSVTKKPIRIKKQKRKESENQMLNISIMNDSTTNQENDPGYSHIKKIKKIFLDEKDKYKFRICFIKNFAEKYIQIMKSTAENIFENLDDWIIKSVSLQNESLNYIIQILKNYLFKEKKLIEQEKDIDYIELDEFEKIIDDGSENKNKSSILNNSEIGNSNIIGSWMEKSNDNDIKLKPFDNSSIINNRIYNKINLNYLIAENFLDTKIEEQYDIKNKKKHLEPKIKIIPPSPIYNHCTSENNLGNISSTELNADKSTMINNKTYKNKNMNDSEFYFDIEKFIFLYKLIKKYEVEDGYINKDVFFSIFVRQYLIIKNNYINKKRKNSDDSDESNGRNMDINLNYFYKEELNTKSKQNIMNNNISHFPIICQALKKLDMKQIKRFYYCFGINIEKLNYIQKISQENKKEKDKRNTIVENINDKKDKKKSVIKTLKRRQTMNQINNSKFKGLKLNDKKDNKNTKEEIQKNNTTKNNTTNTNNTIDENKNKDENIEYNAYLNTKEIFTILPLLGVNILTPEEEDKIEKELKNKLVMGKYLTKTDFLEYKFWFEPFFDFYIIEETDENKETNMLKEFLFDLWKNDENSTYFNFEKFFTTLKVNKYVTDFTDFNEVRYYDIIFS